MSRIPAQPPVRRVLAIVLALFAVGGFAVLLRPSPVPVDVARIARGPLKVTIDEEGKSRIKDVFVVSAPIAGRVLRSSLEVGDDVEGGKSQVASILPSPPPFLDVRSGNELRAQIAAARAAVELAEAEVKQAQAEFMLAENDLARARALSTRDVVSARTLEKARIDVETRKAALARMEANRRLREREFDGVNARLIGPESSAVESHGRECCVTVTSPVSGRVLAIHQKSEQVVSQGAPLIEIGDPRKLELVVELLSADAVRVKPGALAVVTSWGGPDLAAQVTRIEPAGFTKVSALGIEEQRVRAILDFEETAIGTAMQRLGHNFRVFVRITVHDVADALLVPLGAIFRQNDEWTVYVVDGGIARLRRIEIGHRDIRHAVVTKGLEQGSSIVLHPSDRVADGVRVMERKASN